MFNLIANMCFAIVLCLFMIIGTIEKILLCLLAICKAKLREIKEKSNDKVHF